MSVPRILAFDGGMNLGFGALGGGRAPVAGSFRLRGGPHSMGPLMRDADHRIRQMILQEKPAVIGFATLFVGMTRWFDKKKQRWIYQPIPPANISPLFGTIFKVEEIADELKIRCVEDDEGRAREAFMGAIPRGTKAIKAGTADGCYARGWPSDDEHGCDALCMASWFAEKLAKDVSHEQTPLFQQETAQ